MKFTVGADPEVFAMKGGKYISAIDRMPGTKEEPFPIEEGGALQVDNVACEFNTAPATTPKGFSSAVVAPLRRIEAMLAEQGLTVADVAYAKFELDQLEDYRALEAGCEPDFCAYNEEQNFPPMLFDTQYRSAAGHVHVGVEIDDRDVPLFIKIMDLVMTIPSLHVETPERRTLYGKAGCYRRKSYGVEYRTPSNHWIFKESRREWVYGCVKKAVEFFKVGVELPNDLQNIIDSNDTTRATELVNEYNLETCPN